MTIEDVLRIAPRRYIDYSNVARIDSPLLLDGDVTVEGEIVDLREQYGGRPRVTARISDGTGGLTLIWFNTFIAKQLKEGDRIFASGTIRRSSYGGGLEMVTRSGSEPMVAASPLAAWRPSIRLPRACTRKTCGRSPGTRWTPRSTGSWTGWPMPGRFSTTGCSLPPIEQTYERLHYPESMDEVAIAKRRLQFENLLLLQLGLVDRKWHVQASPAQPFTIDEAARRIRRRHAAVHSDRRPGKGNRRDHGRHRQPRPMTRLLQGDVGSGKTAVAATIALIARDNGKQTAMMAPTELLAEQHERSLERLYAGLPESERPRSRC